jgi:hypothetical protein
MGGYLSSANYQGYAGNEEVGKKLKKPATLKAVQ